jgi:lipoprotein-releasing system permease protein
MNTPGSFTSKFKFRLHLGLRYLQKKSKNGGINIIPAMIFIGITGGLSILIVVLGVMNGFQENHISRRIEIGSYHISISRNDRRPLTLKEAMEWKEKLYAFTDRIEAAVPYSDREIIMHHTRRRYTEEQIIKVRAVDPDEVMRDSRFNKFFSVEYGDFDLSEYSVLLGKELGLRILAHVGSDISFSPDISLRSLKSKGIPFSVNGFFYTGSYDYDRYWGFISIYSLIALTGRASIDSIGIKMVNPQRVDSLVTDLKIFMGDDFIIETAQEINRGYFAALRLEKTMILFLFFMFFLMVATNTFGALKLTILEKRQDISILKALGARPRDLEIIFIIESLVIGFCGCFFGVLLGTLISYNITNIFSGLEFILNSAISYLLILTEHVFPQLYIRPVKLYDETVYYQSSFLVKIELHETIIMALLILFMTVISAWLPISRASRLKPNEILKS